MAGITFNWSTRTNKGSAFDVHQRVPQDLRQLGGGLCVMSGVISAIRAFSRAFFAPIVRSFRRLQDDAVWFADWSKRPK